MNDELLNNYIEKYQTDLTRLCMSLCGSVYDADDLYQETWLKVMRKYDSFDTSRPFDKWLFSICVNTYKDTLRLAWRKKQLQFNTNEDKDLFLSSITCSDEFDKDEEDYIALWESICKLPPKQRIVIALFYFKEYSHSEVAQILNIPEGTVKSRLHKAKILLKEALK